MIPKLEYYKQKWSVESDSSIKPGLMAIENALELLGNPHKRLAVIHIAGTNGKGSTITFLDEICQAHHLNVGKFMSPCIVDIHDQLQINGQPIDENALDKIFATFSRVGLSGKLTDFELLTCAAFVHFANEKTDVVLLETGMGGLLDSTNVVHSIVSVITSIALEHTNFLGDTLEQIATHKAGIIKAGCPVVIGEMPEEAMTVIKQIAIEKQANLYVYDDNFFVKDTIDGELFLNDIETISSLQRSMLGRHQRINMAIAIQSFLIFAKAQKLEVDVQSVRLAIAKATLAGRFEEVLPSVYFEGAHNPASVRALVDILKQNFGQYKIEFIIGMLKDKDVKTVLQLIEPIASKIEFIDFDNQRALDAQSFYDLSNHHNKSITDDVIASITAPVPNQTVRIVTGSLYLLSSLRELMRSN